MKNCEVNIGVIFLQKYLAHDDRGSCIIRSLAASSRQTWITISTFFLLKPLQLDKLLSSFMKITDNLNSTNTTYDFKWTQTEIAPPMEALFTICSRSCLFFTYFWELCPNSDNLTMKWVSSLVLMEPIHCLKLCDSHREEETVDLTNLLNSYRALHSYLTLLENRQLWIYQV